MKKLLVVLGLVIIFLCSTIDFSDAKGGSSFSGGGRSSGSFSSSGSSGAKSGSGSGWGSSASKYTTPSTPSTPSTPAPTSKGWTTSGGKTADTPTASNKSTFSSSGSGSSESYKPSPSTSTSKSWNWGGGSSSTTTRVYTPRYVAPSTWTPHYYTSPGYYYGGPSLFDLWWKFELLDTIRDRHDRDTVIRELRSSPEYATWKAEAAKLSDENSELKEKLQKLEAENKTVADLKEDDSSSDSMSTGLIILISLISVVVIVAVFVKILC